MKKVLFIDRDGTLILEPVEDQQVDSLEKLTFYPGVFTALSRIARESEFELVMVTNQDGLGTASFPEETFWPAHRKMMEAFEGEGITFAKVHIDPTLPEQQAPTRKPGTGMLVEYLYGPYDLAQSYVIGDRESDVQLAENLGAQAIFMGEACARPTALSTRSWSEIAEFLLARPRTAEVRRTTSETDIEVRLNLDGNGGGVRETGLGFLDHMLDQLARHGGVDLDIRVRGDLHVDEHHTVEDTALALGEAFKRALGQKKGISRYGFYVPMDDVLAQAVIDFGGRPWLVWDAKFEREKIGEVPTEMFFHFFKSFTDAAACNLNLKAEGDNEHHKIEGLFKAFARAIRGAVARTGGDQIPSTKGSL